MLNLLMTAAADTTATGGTAALLMQVLPFVAIIAVFYFLLIRPESKRKKAMQKMLSELMVGDEVTTIGGLIGRVVNIKDDEVTLETGSDRVRLKFQRSAISSKKQIVSE